MQFLHTSEMPALCFEHRNAVGEPRWVIVARETYEIESDGGLQKLAEQPALNFQERGFGDVLTTAPREESDLAPEKPNVDLIINANAYAPNGHATERFTAAFRLSDPQDKTIAEHHLEVTGPRSYSVGPLGGHHLSEPAPALEVPLNYGYAYGGTLVLPPTSDAEKSAATAYKPNPVGRGFVPTVDAVQQQLKIGHWAAKARLNAWYESVKGRWPAPQLELPNMPMGGPEQPYPLTGWGTVGKHWDGRYQHAGTLDANWEATRHPLLPTDFDSRYWNGGHPRLQFPTSIGGCRLRLHGVVPAAESPRQLLEITIPNRTPRLLARHPTLGKADIPMQLDTVLVDVLDRQVKLLFRRNLRKLDDLRTIRLDAKGAA